MNLLFKTRGTDIYYSRDGVHWFWYVNIECC